MCLLQVTTYAQKRAGITKADAKPKNLQLSTAPDVLPVSRCMYYLIE